MNDKAAIFKPDDIVIDFGDDFKVRLVYDLNSFCELEKMYDSVDTVIQMVLGTQEGVDPNALLTQVKCGDAFIDGNLITVAGTPLVEYLSKVHAKQAKHVDTLNLLWAGALHDHAIYDDNDDIVGYSITKKRLGSYVTFKNLREVNAKIILALLRDLIPAKNVEEPDMVDKAPEQPAQDQKVVKLHSVDHSEA